MPRCLHLFSLAGYWSNSSSLSISNRAMVSNYFYLTCNNGKYEQRLRAMQKRGNKRAKRKSVRIKRLFENCSALESWPFYCAFYFVPFICIMSVMFVVIYISTTQSADLVMRRFHHPQSLLIITILNSSQLGSDGPQLHKATIKGKWHNGIDTEDFDRSKPITKELVLPQGSFL